MRLVNIGVAASSFKASVSASSAWSVSSATLDSGNEYFLPEGFLESLRIKPDGTEIYYLSSGSNDNIYQRTLSTSWDLTTAGTASSFNVSGQDSFGKTFWINDTGTRMYFSGESSDQIFSYTLSTAWDISTASFDLLTGDLVALAGANPRSIYIDTSETYVFVTASNNTIYAFEMTTPGDISTISFRNQTFNVEQNAGDIYHSLYFKTDGTKLYVQVQRNESTSFIYQYALSTAWDITTHTFEESFERTTNDTFRLINSMFINPTNGTEMVLLASGVAEKYDL